MTNIAAERSIQSVEELLQVTWDLRGLRPRRSSELTPNEVNFVDSLRHSPYRHRGRSLELWFRGDPAARHLLAPGAFRKKGLGHKGGRICYEETSATFHFMLRRPEFRAQCQSDFEGLSVFQHYGGLTRLLDWSENATVAAFFAVQEGEHEHRDASLFVLNAALLNAQTGLVHDADPRSAASDWRASLHTLSGGAERRRNHARSVVPIGRNRAARVVRA